MKTSARMALSARLISTGLVAGCGRDNPASVPDGTTGGTVFPGLVPARSRIWGRRVWATPAWGLAPAGAHARPRPRLPRAPQTRLRPEPA